MASNTRMVRCAVFSAFLLASLSIGASGLSSRPANPTCIAQDRPVTASAIDTQRVFPQLSFTRPIHMSQRPFDDSDWFVAEQRGLVYRFPNTADPTTAQRSVFLDIRGRVDDSANEEGLLGMAFHPNYEDPDPIKRKDEVYVSYTGFPSRSVISRFSSSDGGATLDPASGVIILSVNQPYGNHNGGNIVFGPDGYLYIGLGDGGSGGDPQGNGQNTQTLLGSILRIDIDSGSPYAIPVDNPFTGTNATNGLPEIYAWGLRNPWRWSFDSATGDLWAGDVGQSALEEIDIVLNGGNYGWNIKEGSSCYNAASCDSSGLIDPVVEYSHAAGNCSVTGGFVYRGSGIAGLQGTYIFGDYCSGKIWGVQYDSGGIASMPQLDSTGSNIASFAEGNDRELYALFFNGTINKLIPAGPPPVDTFPKQLSQTGCVNTADPSEPDSGLIPYNINARLWSDGASRERWLSIPDGSTIDVSPGGDFVFPVGSVLLKSFKLNNTLVETRLFMRHADGQWGGYSYEWNAAGTDADLVVGGKTSIKQGQSWHYPSGSECLRCHTTASERTLGPEIRQMNRPFSYPSSGITANQLTTLEAIGMFTAALPDIPANLEALSDPDKLRSPLDRRARAYLYANCAMCHQPGGPGGGPPDFRASVSDSNMNICNVDPDHGDLGISGARLAVPGNSTSSIVSARMHALNIDRMPPLGSFMLDPVGTAAVDDWINVGSICGLPDSDGDGVTNSKDNCLQVYNPRRIDADNDTYGNSCDADLDNSLLVDTADLILFVPLLSGSDPVADYNSDGIVDSLDLGIQMSGHNGPPGPTGL